MIERILEPEVMDNPGEAAAYAAMDHREANRAFVDRLIELGIGRCESALDLGTGPGDIPLMLCGDVPGVAVLAVDLARSMLDLAESAVQEVDLGGRIELSLMDVKALEVEDASFDAVFSNTILHHLPEPGAMLAEARRVLKPGGLLLIRDLYRPDSTQQLEALVAKHAADCDDGQRRLFAESLHAALTPDELRELAAAHGLTDAEVVVDSDRHMSLQISFRSRSRNS